MESKILELLSMESRFKGWQLRRIIIPIDINKILKLISMIENEDGENLSLGSIKTLGMIKQNKIKVSGR